MPRASRSQDFQTKVSKNIPTFTHFSVDKLGTNFFTIDLLKSNSADLANGGGSGAAGMVRFLAA